MKLTLSLDAELLRALRKIAVERETTLDTLIRDYLQQLVSGSFKLRASDAEREALERTFQKFQLKVGRRTWRRQDLYTRSKKRSS